ncbi:hypothetical protein RIF29_29193 [Crotalaria pallida]|uniref:Uncharacterized protein n=1 Tax=Crotalaria pallida TaxID=3830 RepID=A0AAN9HW17_CROPI
MARKRGRPPKTPSSSGKKPPSKPQDTIDDQPRLDLNQLDEDDLEEIDNLTPKKAEALLKNLDLLREKIKGKTMQEVSSPGNKASNPVLEEKQVKKQWVEKKRPTREDNEKLDNTLKAEDEAAVEKIVEETSNSVIKITASNSRGTKVAETGDETGADKEGDMSPGVVSNKPQDDGGTVGNGFDNTEQNAEQPWITVRTKSKTQAKHEAHEGIVGNQQGQASKANG